MTVIPIVIVTTVQLAKDRKTCKKRQSGNHRNVSGMKYEEGPRDLGILAVTQTIVDAEVELSTKASKGARRVWK